MSANRRGGSRSNPKNISSNPQSKKGQYSKDYRGMNESIREHNKKTENVWHPKALQTSPNAEMDPEKDTLLGSAQANPKDGSIKDSRNAEKEPGSRSTLDSTVQKSHSPHTKEERNGRKGRNSFRRGTHRGSNAPIHHVGSNHSRRRANHGESQKSENVSERQRTNKDEFPSLATKKPATLLEELEADAEHEARNKPKVKLSLAEFHSTMTQPETNEMSNDEPSRILWVGNIGPGVSEDEIMNEFSKFGKLESIRILHNRFCAFVNFEEVKCAAKAKKSLEGMKMGSQFIVINFRKPDRITEIENNFSLNPSRALWIGNISSDVTRDQLLSEFEPFGPIESVRLLAHKTCAFVNFKSVEDATAALQTLQSKKIGKMAIKINFGKPPSIYRRPGDGYGIPEFPPRGYYPYYPYMPPFPMMPYMVPDPSYMYIPPLCDVCGKHMKEITLVPCNHSACSECIASLGLVGDSSPPDKSKCPCCSEPVTTFLPLTSPPFPPHSLPPMYPFPPGAQISSFEQ